MADSLSGNTTKTAPIDYLENLLDAYATSFNQSLVGKLGYEIPKLLTGLALKESDSASLGSILDLGCGNGLTGLEIREFCYYLEGSDSCYKMLEVAKTKDVYDKLDKVDIVEYLSNSEPDFDYFVSTDVFIYVGELFEVFRLIKAKKTWHASIFD